MIQVAIDWFGLEADEIITGVGVGEKITVHRDRGKLNVIQGDGVEHIMSLSDRKQSKLYITTSTNPLPLSLPL